MAFDFAALNAVRHHRNRTEEHTGPASTPKPESGAAKAAIIHRVIHKGVGMFVSSLAGAIDSGGLYKGGMPAIGSDKSGVGLDILGGFGGSVFEFIALWRGMKLGYVAPVVSGASDALLFYWSGKQGQLWGNSKRVEREKTSPTGTETGFDYALPQGRRDASPAHATGKFAFDPLHGFAAQ